MKKSTHKLKEKFVGATSSRLHFEGMTKSKNGITLIALIITIIVMLILVGVSVTVALNGGLFTTSKQASEETEENAIYEQIVSAMNLTNEGKMDLQRTYDAAKRTLEVQGYTLGELQADGTFEVTGKRGTYKYRILERQIIIGEGNNKDEVEIGKATVGTIAQKNSTIDGEVYSSTNPIIPAGFAPINIITTGQESTWDANGGPQVNNGLVITDNIELDESGKTKGSEFVWIPVPDINKMVICQEHGANVALNLGTLQCPTCGKDTMYAGKLYMDVNYSFAEFDSSAKGQVYKNAVYSEPTINYVDNRYIENLTQDQLQNEFDSMVRSVSKYGGFYIGRYEMSLTTEKTAQSKYGVVTADASKEDSAMWYGLYTKAKTYVSTKNSVQSTMIWGSQYDSMLVWMENNGGKIKENIGNLKNMNRISGTAEKDVIKNVYDLYGNSYEWTLESYARWTWNYSWGK